LETPPQRQYPIWRSVKPISSLWSPTTLPSSKAHRQARSLTLSRLANRHRHWDQPPFRAPAKTFSVTQAIFNGDGKDDIVWRNVNTGDVYIWLSNGASVMAAGWIGNPDGSWKIVGIGDFDGGGKRDIVWYNAWLGQLSIWVMNGFTRTGNYEFPAPASRTAEWAVVDIADFDKTGLSDILWQDKFTGRLYL
jgi:hypothetical protein